MPEPLNRYEIIHLTLWQKMHETGEVPLPLFRRQNARSLLLMSIMFLWGIFIVLKGISQTSLLHVGMGGGMMGYSIGWFLITYFTRKYVRKVWRTVDAVVDWEHVNKLLEQNQQ